MSPERLPKIEQLGPYRIEGVLGEGGMGVVYRALDTKLNRPVALKVLYDDLADATARRRFQREAEMASSLNHPHILTVHDAGEFEERQYLVTELVDGGTISDWARAEKRLWRQIVELLVGVADGLAAAHQAGILHRDIKPANILVAKNGYAKLADFGLSKLVVIRENEVTRSVTKMHTREGVILGTIAYMSPEQACGSEVDARSDIYSFGVVLYELLADRRPFAGTSDLEVLQTIIHGEPVPLGEEFPISLRMVVEKALEKDPAERYQSMREMVVDLRRLTKRNFAGSMTADRAKTRSNWIVWAALFGLALAGLGLWESRRFPVAAENPLADAHFTRFTNFPGAEHDASISPDGKFVAFRSDRDGPFDVWVSQVGSGEFVNLTHGQDDELRTPVWSAGFSSDGSEIWLGGAAGVRRLRIMPLLGGPARLFLPDGAVTVSWSPDGTHLVYHTGQAGDPIFVADRTGANAKQIFINPSPGGHNHFPMWSADSRSIYFVSGFMATNEMDLWRIDATGGTAERFTHHSNDVRYPTLIDPRTLLYVMPADDGSGPWLWALDIKLKAARRVSFGLEKYTSVAASADGHRVVATVANPTANLWSVPLLDRLAEERDVKPFPLPSVRAWLPRYGGESLFYLSSRGTGDGLWRYQDNQAFEVWKGSDGALLEPAAVSPDARRAVVVLRRNGKRRLQIISSDGAEFQAVGEAIDVQGSTCWSPDGKWIVTGGDDGKGPGLFKIPVGGGSPVRLRAGPAFNPVWSPDGSLIVYAGPTVALYAPLLAVHPDGTPGELPAIRFRGDWTERARFLPNGKGLIYMQGSLPSQDFWLLDLATKKTRPLTHLSDAAAMRTFDIMPDSKHIVFDRFRENSDIVLIDLPK